MALLVKRKRSSDAVSDAGTASVTDASTPRRELDEKSQQLAQQRGQHAAAKLELEQLIKQAHEQKEHVAMQLDQLEGCEGSADLRSQLQEYAQQEQQAQAELAKLDRQFEAAVSRILGLPAEQQSRQQLEAAMEQQQALQQAQVQQLAVEQQLAGHDFAVSKPQAKKARLDRMTHVWDWLQGSGSGDITSPTAAAAAAAGPAPLDTAPSRLSSDPALDQVAGSNGHAAAHGEQLQPGSTQQQTAAGQEQQDHHHHQRQQQDHRQQQQQQHERQAELAPSAEPSTTAPSGCTSQAEPQLEQEL